MSKKFNFFSSKAKEPGKIKVINKKSELFQRSVK